MGVDAGYIKNCYINPRDTDESFRLGKDTRLDGYAIIPVEQLIEYLDWTPKEIIQHIRDQTNGDTTKAEDNIVGNYDNRVGVDRDIAKGGSQQG